MRAEAEFFARVRSFVPPKSRLTSRRLTRDDDASTRACCRNGKTWWCADVSVLSASVLGASVLGASVFDALLRPLR